ncbi:GNAT family N-acetyltransferase [Achromobacter dolens]|uniref:GNAT family N-acetyltransferase n=1 Tax=Achromobacter dolens TaxID=1287738 RepID=UPI00158344FE|nr:GNAT family N-acetyltransferase [Achromobacter dolens]
MDRAHFPFPDDVNSVVRLLSFSDPVDGDNRLASAEAMVKSVPGEGFFDVLGEDSDHPGKTGALISAHGRVVGWLVIEINGDGDVELYKIFVAAEERGRGFGSKAADLLIEAARAHGYTGFFVSPHPHLDDAHEFWEKFAEKRKIPVFGVGYYLEFEHSK